MEELNKNIFLTLNSFAGQHHTLDLLMIIVADYMPYIFIILLFYLWFNDKKKEALYAGYATILGIATNQLIGTFFYHNKPFMHGLGLNLLPHKVENSFPSDHTTFTLSIAFMLLTFKQTRILGIVTTILALWCGLARVYAGAHYPFDIVGSIIVATIAVIVISVLNVKFKLANELIISIWNKIFKSQKNVTRNS